MDKLNLQLFAEGGEGGEAVAEEGSLAKSNAEEGQVAEPTSTEERKTFEELIKGEYKDDYNKKVQEAIKRRFKENEDTSKKMESLNRLAEFVGQKYGKGIDDIEALISEVENDDSYYEQEAIDKGLTVEQLKEIKKIQRDNALLKAEIERKNAEDRQQREWMRIVSEAEELKRVYPSFDLNAEMLNEHFGRLIASNVSVRDAFELVHKDQLQPRAMEMVAEKAKESVAKAIPKRVSENGLSSQAPAVTKIDPSKLSLEQIREYTARANRGETIDFITKY